MDTTPRPAPPYTLERFNKQQAEMYERLAESRKPHMNNIACPNCGTELWDVEPIMAYKINPAMIDPGNPPTQGVECRAEGCGFVGVRNL